MEGGRRWLFGSRVFENTLFNRFVLINIITKVRIWFKGRNVDSLLTQGTTTTRNKK